MTTRTPRSGSVPSARAAACEAVAFALEHQGFIGEHLARLRAEQGSTARDVGFASEIALGTMRRFQTLQHLLVTVAPHDRQRVSTLLRAILLTGAYQIVFMNRVPEFAAVDESVTLARRLVGGRAHAMANALLRRLAGAIHTRSCDWQPGSLDLVRTNWSHACRFRLAVLPDPARQPESSIALATGESLAIVRNLVARFGVEKAEQIAWASTATPVTILNANTLRASFAEVVAAVQTECPHAALSSVGDAPAIFLPPDVHVGELTVVRDGRAYVQDATAHQAALAVDAKSGERILDLCAAPGGKSIAMAIASGDRAEIVACDTSGQRLDRVRENAERLGLRSIRSVLLSPGGAPAAGELGRFNAVLADVPCSNSGVFSRRPEARLRLNAESLRSLAELQTKLLIQAASYPREGGGIIYSTCSIEGAENEYRIREFTGAHPAWLLEEEHLTLPTWGPSLADWRDGGYFARLRRVR